MTTEATTPAAITATAVNESILKAVMAAGFDRLGTSAGVFDTGQSDGGAGRRDPDLPGPF